MPELIVTAIAGAVAGVVTALTKALDLRNKINESTRAQPVNLLADLTQDKLAKRHIEEVYQNLERVKPTARLLMERRLRWFMVYSCSIVAGLVALLVLAIVFAGMFYGDYANGVWVSVFTVAVPVIVVIFYNHGLHVPKGLARLAGSAQLLLARASQKLGHLREEATKAMEDGDATRIGAADERFLNAFHQLRALMNALERFELSKKLDRSGELLHDYLASYVVELGADAINSLVTRNALAAHTDNRYHADQQIGAIQQEWARNGLSRYLADMNPDFFRADFVTLLNQPSGKQKLVALLKASHSSFDTVDRT